MKKVLGLVVFNFLFTSSVALAQSSLLVVFPPTNYQTSTEKIFFIGITPANRQLLINGKPIKRSKAGHFSPSLPLQLGENVFKSSYPNQEREIKITRPSTQPEFPDGLGFAKDSLTPAVDIARLPGELICFGAIAPPQASVSVKVANQIIPLSLQPSQAKLPANSSVLTGRNQPTTSSPSKYQGCTTVAKVADLGQPLFSLTLNGNTATQLGQGKISILTPAQLPVTEVTAPSGVTRTGPSTDYSRLTPLPKGTRAKVTGREGDWLRLDYGAWINSKETKIIPDAVQPQTVIRSVGYRQRAGETEILFPLQVAVPVSIEQSDNRTFSITFHNTTAQTDTIRLDDNPLISRLDWQQVTPNQVKYTLNLKKLQQWGYKLRYDNTTLVLSLRHAPNIHNRKHLPLSGIKIVLDPGHGGKESGSSGMKGYLAKDVNLVLSKLLRDELVQHGAVVVMTREDDRDVSLVERQEIINKEEPALALSIHYNFLPDDGNAEKTRGLVSFWYHSQAHSPAIFLHNYVVNKHREPSIGVFWNNLALTRPSAAPAMLLEFRLMSNADELEEIVNPQQQKKLAKTLADGVTEWFKMVKK
ncbi:N-acetylmuramoyl-L-alanine amidase [Anabaena cylindrica FACHB-243]|uniref:Cell wall hydrolase/autolysin n=1 Tax=Anabaena cylindrica (strain ATCC 27899 / PCC 7122) TaxID=272123 RepID=K9ZED3_ANACC|nr:MULTISPECIES: N-acetylmuramoyl-L-alanine amidase [Anabaena]AFZ56967.1 cell wall hydrolase/autolysin [Anabaena cylindrica PCC 7122]MBD2418876.1 N-acetylmuramoyl-L-alanine amidase [Anabaena cylindrica FACHB-243]MBY5284916.1 N-acetylmuramoyl-L-alanine amidase [Anabaena sp. CCAP 1446/1C]MBY5310935.1 N-acetylmuramoyl-L-alanine amidase [Anabaena sp. CCAP 1446/1C]MCM2405156.1 N-acetylmuramoyl-L-alanine amidase [Anabaena sp. CCAP 1446/1C]